MSDEQVKSNETGEEKQGRKIELPEETYDALLERVAVLEEQEDELKTQKKSPKSVVDELADEGLADKRDEPIKLPDDFDDLTNTQLLTYIAEAINSQAGPRLQQLEKSIHTLKVRQEIDSAASRHEDFWTYEDEIRQIAIDNPTLRIEDAYQLAKSRNPKPTAPKEGETPKERRPTRTERLLNLKHVSYGEKPNVAAASTEKVLKGDLSSAAERAWEEHLGKDKDFV